MESWETLENVINVLVNMLLELAVPSTLFILALLGYGFLLYLREIGVNILGISPSNPFYGPMDTLVVGIGFIVAIIGALGFLEALKHLRELKF